MKLLLTFALLVVLVQARPQEAETASEAVPAEAAPLPASTNQVSPVVIIDSIKSR